MPHSCSRRFASRQRGDIAPSATADLTPREAEMAAWLARGKTNWEISIICRVSARTVEKHVERILQKLNVANRTAAVMAIIEKGLLP
jgi:DNA-binding CsgD family transcriptional regulator